MAANVAPGAATNARMMQQDVKRRFMVMTCSTWTSVLRWRNAHDDGQFGKSCQILRFGPALDDLEFRTDEGFLQTVADQRRHGVGRSVADIDIDLDAPLRIAAHRAVRRQGSAVLQLSCGGLQYWGNLGGCGGINRGRCRPGTDTAGGQHPR